MVNSIQTAIAASQPNAQPIYFEGRVDGQIATEKHGTEGFGYDPIFVPNNHEITFAEMLPEEKNKISHRKIAIDKLLEFLK